MIHYNPQTTTTPTPPLPIEWYNIHIGKVGGRNYTATTNAGNMEVVVENYSDHITNGNYQFCLTRKNRTRHGCHWTIPFLSAAETSVSGNWTLKESAWNVSGSHTHFWNDNYKLNGYPVVRADGSVVASTLCTAYSETSGFASAIKLQGGLFKKYRHLDYGVALYRKEQDGTWKRISNVAYFKICAEIINTSYSIKVIL